MIQLKYISQYGGITSSNITNTSADISWNQVYLSEKGSYNGNLNYTINTIPVTTSYSGTNIVSKHLTGLTAFTTYTLDISYNINGVYLEDALGSFTTTDPVNTLSIKSSNVSLSNIFQPKVSGVLTAPSTFISNNSTNLSSIFAGRDNKSANAVTNVTHIESQSLNLNSYFNKIDATYDVTIGGTASFTGSNLVSSITFSNQNPSNAGISAPVAVGTAINIGTWGPTWTSSGNAATATGSNGGIVAITMPGNYLAGNVSGTFTIQ